MPRLALSLLLSAAALLAPASAHAVVVGISDQKPAPFFDLRYRALGLTESRLVVPWDSMRYRWQIAEIDAWLDAARQAGVEQPLIAFERSRVRRDVTPTPKQYMSQFRRFRQRYPQLRAFTVWNEPNLWHQPVADKVGLIVGLYRRVKRSCRRCTVLPGELIDTPSMAGWAREFERRLGHAPPIWGLHNYRDVNRRETTTTRALLRLTKARVWLTETGGIVGRERGAKRGDFPQTARNAARATRFLFRAMPRLSRRIERIYVYHWSAQAGPSWDSAFIAAGGRARPALAALIGELKRLRLGAFRSTG